MQKTQAKDCLVMSQQIIASSLALIGFAVALVMGMAAGNGASTTIVNAMWAGAACMAVGWLIARIAASALHEHLAEHRNAHPIDPDPTSTDQPDAAAESAANSSQDATGAAQAPAGESRPA